MPDLLSLLTSFDELCAALAAALQHAAPQIYPTVALVVVIAFLTISSRKGPDQL
jgi:hypothetical protein